MNNRQGFLSHKLNKYSIRKMTVGTASLLVGATLVFGIENEAKAEELDTISTNTSSDKGQSLDIQDIDSPENNNITETSLENNSIKKDTIDEGNATQTSESPDIKSNNAQSATNETSKEESATEEKSIEANDTPKIVE
ncbi:YSIRK-type signal peptide-containing protein, partial [Staphylococcus caprae]